jgi:hypothetical protein
MHTNFEPRTFDFTGSCLLIKPFRVALFHNVEGRIDEDFDKVETGVLVDLASKRAIIAVGRDERGQRYTRSVRKQARDLSSWWPPKNDFYGKAAEGWRGGNGIPRDAPRRFCGCFRCGTFHQIRDLYSGRNGRCPRPICT